jgi:pseudouridine-5'-monophosphatase
MNNVSQRYGKQFTWEIKEKIMGTTASAGSKVIVDEMSLPITPEELVQALDVEYKKVFPKVSLLPGVQKLLDHLKKHKVPMAIASSSKRTSFELKTTHFGPEFQKYFHHVVLASDEPEVKHSKPAPDTFLVCWKRFSPVPKASDCLVFEDSVAGVMAGVRAGMPVVWIPDARLDVQSYLKKERDLRPTQILSSMTEFRPQDFGLPPYDD